MAYHNPLEVKLWGERACFTRPEMKVERVSYPVMTPSAARGVLEAIFWKPEFTWRIRAIKVLKPIQRFSMVRNEVTARASKRTEHIGINAHRTPRHTLGLRDVAYIIQADQVLRSDVGEDAAKYRDQFRRRVRKGRCFHRPYLGCREFEAYFCEPDGTEEPIDSSEPLGRMLLDIEFRGDGTHQPHFFRAELKGGVLEVPGFDFNLKERGDGDVAR